MLNVRSLADRVGPTLLRGVVLPEHTGDVGDVVIAEPFEPARVAAGDLVLGVGVTEMSGAIELARDCGAQGAAAVLFKPPFAADEAVVAEAGAAGLPLIEVRSGTAWAQLVWLIRTALAGSATGGGAGRPVELGDLFRLADAAADVVDAPVTIEDAHSQVLAHSARQDFTDPARVSTIMGRRQPDDVLAKFRAYGTFRQLSKANSAVFVPAQQDGTLPRLVVPLRMGGELLGSMWAVVPGPVPEDRATAFADTAPLVAVQLLRWRALADAQRQRSAEQVRLVLDGDEGWREAATELGMPNEAHRVVAIDVGDTEESTEGARLALWEWITRGIGRRPLVAEVSGLLYALVPERGGWPALREALANHDVAPGPLAAAGTATGVADLARSRAQADEVLSMLRAGQVRERIAEHERLWHLLALNRMAGAAIDAGVGNLGPLPGLREHDRTQGTDYVETLHAWLRHPGDPRTASRELRVHPNTFRYRMKRLAQVVDVDLDDVEVRAALLMQLLAAHWTRHG